MDKHFHIKPYSFRGRLLLFLLLSAIATCLLSSAGSFIMGMNSVSNELAGNERELAVYLLGLQQKTDLPTGEMLAMTANNTLHTELAPQMQWTQDELVRLQEGEILTLDTGLLSLPSTYLLLNGDCVRIHPVRGYNLFLSVLPRVGWTILLTLILFALLSSLVSFWISRPVTQLTRATARIKDGDFTIRLPEDKHGEVGELMRSFNSMTEALSRNLYLQKDFISGVSHEFRTPIASIKGFARLLQMPGLTEETRAEYIDLIATEADRLSRLSDTLLRLSALEQQSAPASLTEVRLDEQLRQVVLRLEPAWSAKDIDWNLALEPVTVVTDTELLMQVWVNVIQNAIKFSPNGGLIEISLARLDCAEVTVTDHGPGMDQATLQRIFDRFYQGDTSRSKDGVGLGLCLVKRITDILGCTMTVRSAPGEGSTFRIRVPLRNDQGGRHDPSGTPNVAPDAR